MFPGKGDNFITHFTSYIPLINLYAEVCHNDVEIPINDGTTFKQNH